MNIACTYCRGVIVPTDDAQQIDRRTFAHSSCAWAVNDEFFAGLDAMESINAKCPTEINGWAFLTRAGVSDRQKGQEM